MANFTVNVDAVRTKRELAELVKSKLQSAGMLMVAKTAEKLSGQRSGRRYRVPGTGTIYQASAPGESPAVRTGDLRQRISYKIDVSNREIVVKVGSPHNYAVHLEYGTRKMLSRPFLKPTYEENRIAIMRLFAR